ncbi:MAG TPA: class I SAM-dependent methyltransferase [Anaerolineaceae bacterium]
MENYTQQNRRAWNEIARVRQNIFPLAAFFAGGGSTLDARAVSAARAAFGEIHDLRVIHLQCATGEDTLSWAVLGARAVGVDISDEQIAIAGAKAGEAGLPAHFYAADLYALPGALPPDLQGGYDVVFTGGGALVWLPDLTRWARVIAALLRPGGRLVLLDEHPLSGCLWVENGQLVITSSYFSREAPEVDKGWWHFKGGEDAREIKYEFNWPLGDVVTALAQAGLVIEGLEEFPGGPAWRFGELQALSFQLPCEYLLVARK